MRYIFACVLLLALFMAKCSIGDVVFDERKLTEAKKNVQILTSGLADDLATGEKSKHDVAMEYARLARGLDRSVEERYWLFTAAFNLYVDAKDQPAALRVVFDMLKFAIPRREVLTLMKNRRVTFGAVCREDRCCLKLIDTLQRAVKPGTNGLQRISLADFADSRHSFCTNNAKRVVKRIDIPGSRTPVEIPCLCVPVVLDMQIGDMDISHLFLEEKTLRPLSLEIESEFESLLTRKDFKDRILSLKGDMEKNFDCDIRIVDVVDVRRECDQILAEMHEGHAYESHDHWLPTKRIEDYCIGAFQVRGLVEEDVHHWRSLHLEIDSECVLADWWQEYYPTYVRLESSIIETFMKARGRKIGEIVDDCEMCMFGLIGHCYEKGLYGIAANQKKAAWWYRKAASLGNVSAQKWIAKRPDSGDGDEEASIYGIQMSRLSLGLGFDDGGIRVLDCFDAFEDRAIRPWYRTGGLRLALLGNRTMGDESSFQFACLGNLVDKYGSISGVQIGTLNFMEEGASGNGLQIGLLGNAVRQSGVFRGMQVGFENFCIGSEMNGVQIGGANMANELNGVQAAPYMNLFMHSMCGVQVSLCNFSFNASFVDKNCVFQKITNQMPASEYRSMKSILGGENEVNGVQIAGVLNWCEGRVNGVQIGPVNFAESLRGVQLGLINVAHNSLFVWMPGINVGF